MKYRLLPFAILVASVASTIGINAAKTNNVSDPVVMTINGKDIPLSEFKYLYNKNNSQQVSPMTVYEYAEMFVDYKLKVADAEANGIDTTQTFLKEFEKYRDELAAPYMTDASVEDSLIREIYDHMQVNRDVYYIMMYGGRTAQERETIRNRADSIRTVIVNGQGDWGELADKFSVDKNQGHMGYMLANRYPYEFEKAVYDCPVGEVSPVHEFPFGFFIVKVADERPDKGQVEVQHILKLTRGLSDEEIVAKKDKIDSLYTLVNTPGVDFSAVAMTESEDPGSASKGGKLPFFGAGQMVKPFEDASFALAVGEISRPIETAYGYHIIKKLDSRENMPLSDARQGILTNIKRDSRGDMPAQARLNQFKKEYGAKVNDKVLKSIKKDSEKKGVNDSTFIAQLLTNDKVVASVADTKITVADVAKQLEKSHAALTGSIYDKFSNIVTAKLDDATREYALSKLPEKHDEYKNLINEYRDGMLLFEVSNNNVWEKSTKDAEGLEKYFNAHRDKYTWTAPHYKGYVVFAPNDSVGELAKAYAAEIKATDDPVKSFKTKFGKNVKVEKVLAAKGDNQIIDYIAFDGATPENVTKQWPYFFKFRGEVINAPQEASDVKGLVAIDYQQELEKAWIEKLRATYPVTINKDVLKLAE